MEGTEVKPIIATLHERVKLKNGSYAPKKRVFAFVGTDEQREKLGDNPRPNPYSDAWQEIDLTQL